MREQNRKGAQGSDGGEEGEAENKLQAKKEKSERTRGAENKGMGGSGGAEECRLRAGAEHSAVCSSGPAGGGITVQISSVYKAVQPPAAAPLRLTCSARPRSARPIKAEAGEVLGIAPRGLTHAAASQHALV